MTPGVVIIMGDAGWVALGAIIMALINSTASVLMLYIRAKYKWTDGMNERVDTSNVQPPHG